MEIKVDEIKDLAPIKFNYEDVKNWVTQKAKEYKSLIYTEETITEAKTDRATLNKLAKAINDEKIRVKKEVLKPFEDFESKCKELQGIIVDASNSIDTQVKAFEEKEQNEKKEKIKEIFDSYVGIYKNVINFDMIFNQKWLNKSYTMKKITEDINHIMVKASEDMDVLKNQIEDENILKQVQSFYFPRIADPNCLSQSLQYGMNIIEENKKLDELKKVKEEKEQKEVDTVRLDKPIIIDRNNSNEELQQIDFRVWVTQNQKEKIRDFLIENKISYGKVD